MRVSDWSSDVCSSALKQLEHRSQIAAINPAIGGGASLWLGMIGNVISRRLEHGNVVGAVTVGQGHDIVALIGAFLKKHGLLDAAVGYWADRKSTRLNSSH